VKAGKQEAGTMNDRALSIFLMVMFGGSGAAMMVLAWLQPMLVTEKTMAILIGSVGLLVASIRALVFILPRGEVEIKHHE